MPTTPKIIIAIDGYSSSGKSTMAKALAKRLGYVYVDSGAMYRAVTLYALEHNMIAPDGSVRITQLEEALPTLTVDFEVNPETGASETLLNGRNVEKQIRTMRVSDSVSPVAAVPAVRSFLTALQQKMGERKGIVMDGRDIGTTVFPHAEMKVFVDASPRERARRRFREMQQKGMKADYQEVYDNICRRDHIDRTREVSPLRQAPDAHVLHNETMTLAEQEEWLISLFKAITASL